MPKRSRLERIERARVLRERLLELLYEAQIKGTSVASLVDLAQPPLDRFVSERLRGITEHLGEIEEALKRQSIDWDLDRMPTIDRCILTLGAYELFYLTEVPTAVITNEAVSLANRFSTEDSGRFINGILAGLAEDRPPTVTT
ncbi:MAG: transcription antitermination factor NusB [Ferrimicrobium sp.]